MQAGTARTATAVCVSIAPDPALVRTVRLVAAAVARRALRDEDFVEEIRLAVGEACVMMIGPAGTGRGAAPVTVTLCHDDRLRVVVACAGIPAVDQVEAPADAVEPWALLRGLVEDFAIDRGPESATVRMSWPLS